MIYFDVTKAARAGHRSGLTRVSARLRAELGGAATEVRWDHGFRRSGQKSPVNFAAGDWLLTPELFSADERPGFADWLETKSGKRAAIFHDAIPLKHPHITWPQSVARHPGYLKALARFDHVWAVSDASRRELVEFWRWQGVENPPPVEVLPLGADFTGRSRVTASSPPPLAARTRTQRPALLCLGILEPRKNQLFLLEVCAQLWREGVVFNLHVVGRVNPHFGAPIVTRLKSLRRAFPTLLHHHEAASDAAVTALLTQVRATVFPTLAEGCGLPLLESLWLGVPCVCSDLPVLRENADGGGCIALTLNDQTAWEEALRRVLSDDRWLDRLRVEARTRPLPTWAAAAKILTQTLA